MTDYISPLSIILVRPQLQENIGASARAMANFSLTDITLVSPRDSMIDEKAYAMSSGATKILDDAKIVSNVSDAVKDLNFLCATTARKRGINKPAYMLSDAISMIIEKQEQGQKCGILFGPERTGLENDDMILADALIHVPVNEKFSSLNISQCVLLIAYEYFCQRQKYDKSLCISNEPLATKKDTLYMVEHLISELDNAGFFYPIEKRDSSVRLISNIFTRTQMTEQEVRTIRGVIKSLVSVNKA